ncbi:MAG: ECF-type sigma factor [Candidatus Solibacter sp.]
MSGRDGAGAVPAAICARSGGLPRSVSGNKPSIHPSSKSPHSRAPVYEQIRRIAGNRMAPERPGHSLQPTALVNELYLRLIARLVSCRICVGSPPGPSGRIPGSHWSSGPAFRVQ